MTLANLHGASYDTAMEVLREEVLWGRLVLAETHNDITRTNSQVVWQCSENGAIEKGALLSFLRLQTIILSTMNAFFQRMRSLQMSRGIIYVMKIAIAGIFVYLSYEIGSYGKN